MANIPSSDQADKAYPWLMQFLPTGLKGVAVAALAAAIVSSLASMLNSTATIFTMDIYKQLINKEASESKTVNVGRLSAFVALIIATIMAPLLGGIDQAFQFIQEYTDLDVEEIEFEFIDYGVEEVFVDDDGILLYAPFESFGMIQKELEKRNFEILSSGFERIPQVLKSIGIEEQEEVLQLIEKIEEDDDVQNVYHSMEIKA